MRGLVKTVSINAAVLLVLVVVAELIFGYWLWGPDFGGLNIPRNVRRVVDVSHVYPGGTEIVYSRDHWGFRGSYPDPASIDILVIGGSTTDEALITDGQTWTEVMRRTFARAGNPQAVVNAGLVGHTSYGHIRSFDLWFSQIHDLRPRYVLVYLGINEVALDHHRPFDRMQAQGGWAWRYHLINRSALHRLYRVATGAFAARRIAAAHRQGEELVDAEWFPVEPPPDLAQAAREKAEMVNGYRSRLKTLAGRIRMHAEWLPVPQPPDLDKVRAERAGLLAAYRGRLQVLSQRIRDFGAEPIFITQVRGGYRIRDGRLYGRRNTDGKITFGGYVDITLINAETLKACDELRVTCVDLASALSYENGDLLDTMHTVPRGPHKVATTLYPLLAPHIRDRPENLPKPERQ